MDGNGVRHRFFYLQLLAESKGDASQLGHGDRFSPESISYVLVSYGVHRFLADIDAGRDFLGKGGVVGSLLNQAATFGFQDAFDPDDFTYRTAREFRERYLTTLLKELLKGSNRGQ